MPKQTMRIRPFTGAELEALCRAVADTERGLSGSDIGHFLSVAKVLDVGPAMTKWRRLYNALAGAQERDQAATRVLNFIHHALAPARFFGERAKGDYLRQSANVSLAFVGLQLREDGSFEMVKAASTLREAEARARSLHATLEARGVHADVLRYCRAELLEDNYFHAVLEASKSVAQKVRDRTGLVGDGAEVFDAAFGGEDPLLRVNALANKSEKSEQSGFLNLLKGMAGVFRNPVSHAPRISWSMPEEDALDLFSLASYAHRRIDRASKRP